MIFYYPEQWRTAPGACDVRSSRGWAASRAARVGTPRSGAALELCANALSTDRSTSIALRNEKEGEPAQEFRPDFAMAGVTPITARPAPKAQTNGGLKGVEGKIGGATRDGTIRADAPPFEGVQRRLTMTWSEDCQRKRMSSAQALKAVPSGARVWIQSGCGTPSVLVDALVARAAELRDVEIIHMKTLGAADYTRPEYAGHFRHRGQIQIAEMLKSIPQARVTRRPR